MFGVGLHDCLYRQSCCRLIYENGERTQEAEKRITGDADPDLGKFLNFEEQPKDPAALRGVLWDEKKTQAR